HGVSNGPVEAINGRLEFLRGIALGFRNLDHYILRCLIHAANIRHRINALQNRKSHFFIVLLLPQKGIKMTR
ncbi:hypothetical protein BOR83_12330, partial [Corynebacterium striatum]|nr:hypothetical protein [Corynebacterium striatum]EGT5787789.1 hypothetical protein [Corynebacterium striatum]